MPCIEEICVLGWVEIFIYLLNNRVFAVEVWMFTFFYFCGFNVLFCMVAVGSKSEDSEERIQNHSTSQF